MADFWKAKSVCLAMIFMIFNAEETSLMEIAKHFAIIVIFGPIWLIFSISFKWLLLMKTIQNHETLST